MIKNAEINKDVILEIFRIGSMSGYEEEMSHYIKTFLYHLDIEYTEDNFGNIFNFNNYSKPLLAAHMDTVQDYTDYTLSPLAKIHGNVLRSYGVLGGDDKCGIYTILHLLEKFPDINFAFFVEEEIGAAKGSAFVVEENRHLIKKNVIWSAVIDRRGDSDILCFDHTGTYGTKEFQKALLQIGKNYGFSSNYGTFSDADQISEVISSCNISCGYYGAHTKKEYVVLSELSKSIAFLEDTIINITEKFEAPQRYSSIYSKSISTSLYDYSDGMDYSEPFKDLDDEFQYYVDRDDYIDRKEKETSSERFYDKRGSSFKDSYGEENFYVSTIGNYYTLKELDEILVEIVEIEENNGRIL